MVQQLCADYENVLLLRLRMPISDDLNARSLVRPVGMLITP